MKNINVIALGEFLMNIESDLVYVHALRDILSPESSNSKENVSIDSLFFKFLKEFRVLRGIKHEHYSSILHTCRDYISANKTNLSPDDLSKTFKKNVLINRHLLSLSSKVLSFYEPGKFIPYDSINVKVLKVEGANYSTYEEAFNAAFQKGTELDKMYLDVHQMALYVIKNQSININSEELKIFVENRIKDKLLQAAYRNKN